ncbi:MAG: hypothetical protein E7103_09675 [Prevotella sp.]|nr:hypothetical protein [Prevotella sp.]
MNKKYNQRLVIHQFAMIWNYNAYVEQQHNYYNGKPVDEAVKIDEVIEAPLSKQSDVMHKDNNDPVEAFVERIKDIMMKAETDNGKQKKNNSRSYPVTYIYHVDGKGFCKVMDELLANHRDLIEAYLNEASSEAAVSIKYVAPFIGFVLDTHLFSEAKMPKNELKEVMEHFYGKGTSAVLKMSSSNLPDEAEYLYQTVKEIMKTQKTAELLGIKA